MNIGILKTGSAYAALYVCAALVLAGFASAPANAAADEPVLFDAVVHGTAADVKAALNAFPDAVDERSIIYDTAVCYTGRRIPMGWATPLCFAIVQQDAEKAELLIDAGADLFAEDEDGWTPCAYAAAFGNLDMVKLLVREDRRGFADWESDSGETPLHYAAGYNTADVVRYLVSLDVWDVNLLDDDGYSPADWAYWLDNYEALGVLERAGGELFWYADDDSYADDASVSDTPVFDAVVNGTAHDLKAALYDFPDAVDERSDKYGEAVCYDGAAVYMDGATPLFFAIVQQDAEKVALLIDAGADLFAKAEDGWTPCAYAAAFGNLDTIKLFIQEDRLGFLSWKATVDKTLLHIAAEYNTADVVRYLLSLGEWDVNLFDGAGYSPADRAYAGENYTVLGEIERAGGRLHWFADAADSVSAFNTPVFYAVVNRSAADVKAALAAFPDAVDERSVIYHTEICYTGRRIPMTGATPLCFAIVQQDMKKVSLLVDAGADLFAKDDDGWTPRVYGAAYGNLDIIELLMQKDRWGFLSWVSGTGETPLHCAAGYNSADVVRYLVSLDKWDVNVLDDDGYSPADWAYWLDNYEALDALKEAGGKLYRFADDAGSAAVYTEDTPILDAVVHGTAADLTQALAAFPDAVDERSAKYGEAVSYNGDTVYMDGATPLCFAIVQQDVEKVSLLVDAGADLFAEASGGMTPCAYAAALGNLDTVKLFVQKDRRGFADWESDWSLTLLHIAAGLNTADVVRYLVNLGAWDVNVLNTDGWTPADCAYAEENDEALGVLKEAGGELHWFLRNK